MSKSHHNWFLREQQLSSEAKEKRRNRVSTKKGGFSSLNRRHAERNSTQAERFYNARLNNRK
jgi:hypothetical protein